MDITWSHLQKINNEQSSVQNRYELDAMGGIPGLVAKIGVVPKRGLSESQVADSRERFGQNSFVLSPQTSFVALLWNALCDETLIILIIAAIVSVSFGTWQDPQEGWIDGAAILSAVCVVTIVSSVNDYTKELQFRALEASSQMDERCSVIRSRSVSRINPSELVIGDIIILQAGDRIPADCVLLGSEALEALNSIKNSSSADGGSGSGGTALEVLCDESSLTGETQEVRKSTEAAADCFLLSSCLISAGEDVRAMVIGVGSNSQWGKIKATLVGDVENTPLQDKLEAMTGQIGKIGLAFALATFVVMVVSIWTRQDGHDPVNGVINAFILAVTIVVVAIPEGLPLAVTISLAYSTKKMYQDQCFIRVLAACETMGNVTDICSDKTGTLTENRMKVVAGWFGGTYYSESGIAYDAVPKPVKAICVENFCINRQAYIVETNRETKLGSPATVIVGSKTEGSLLLLAQKWGVDYEQMAAESFHREGGDLLCGFDSFRKFSSALVHRQDGSVRVYIKGAPEKILSACGYALTSAAEVVHLSDSTRQGSQLDVFVMQSKVFHMLGIESHIKQMTRRSLRVLCVAHADFGSIAQVPVGWIDKKLDASDTLQNPWLCCDCVVGISHPLRPDVTAAVQSARQAGVFVRMVTGDNADTARAIASECGILTSSGLVIEGPDFRKLTPAQLDTILPRLQVLARSSPEDKFLLVARLNGKSLPRDENSWMAMHQGKPGVVWEKDRDLLLPGYREEWERCRPDGGHVVGVTGDGTNDAPALKAADVGLAMGITGTNVAQNASDIVILDDNFSSITRAILWGRTVYDNIRKFLQFQLTVNIVALCLVFIGACAGKPPPLNPVMMLWVNLIMDSFGALALGTEAPSLSLLDRKPYKTSCSLVSRPMWRNILVQSAFQLILLLVIMFKGPLLFNTHSDRWCAEFHLKNPACDAASELLWDPYTGQQLRNSTNATVSCLTFRDVCESRSGHCYDSEHDIVAEGLGSLPGDFSFEDLAGFRSQCLDCVSKDKTIPSILFNTFVFCQIFNEFNSRSIFNKWNVISGLHHNPIFVGVITVTVVVQIIFIQFAGKFFGSEPLSGRHWLLCICFAALTMPVGLLMRCLPVSEDPSSFFNNEDSGDPEAVKNSRISQYGAQRSPFAFAGRSSDLLSDGSSSYRDSSLREASQSLLTKWNDDGNV